MSSLRNRLFGIAVTIGCLAIAACGSSDSTDRTGGEIRIGSGAPDNYDPVMFQSVEASEPLQHVYTGLLTYAHVQGPAGAKLIPGLAEAMPTISADERTYTFKLRPDLKYSDGSPVVASDFENTIKRLNYLGGPYASSTASIEGVSAYQKAKQPDADISGIETDDATGEIVVKLSQPDGKILYELGLPNAALTPRAKSPFKAKRDIPGIGPYMLKIVNPTREFVLTKTPGFDIPGIPKGNIDKITAVVSTVPKMTQDVIDNKLDFMTADPAGDLLPQVKSKHSDRFRIDANPPNTYWFFLNESVKPFDKLEARQAVNFAIDSRALQRIFGGRLEPTCNFLPPLYARVGYKKIDPCPYGDPAGPPDLAKARELVKKSGYEGMSVTVWGVSVEPYAATVEYLRDTLDKIGFKAKTKILNFQVYPGRVGDPHTKAQAGFANWYQNFPHPADFFENNLSQKALASNPTFNFGFTSNPDVDAALAKLNAGDPAKNAEEWAAVDRSVIDNADVAVYGNELSTSFFSERMDFNNCNGVHPVYKNDWSLFCLK